MVHSTPTETRPHILSEDIRMMILVPGEVEVNHHGEAIGQPVTHRDKRTAVGYVCQACKADLLTWEDVLSHVKGLVESK